MDTAPTTLANEFSANLADDHSSNISWPKIWGGILALSLIASGAVFYLRGEGLFILILALMISLVAAVFDAVTHRIPNSLTYTAILLGLFINALQVALPRLHVSHAAQFIGGVGPVTSIEGFTVFAFGAMLCLSLGALGGGDMKLIAAIGAMLGVVPCAVVMIYALCAATIYSLINLVLSGRLNRVLAAAGAEVLLLFLTGYKPTRVEDGARKVPMAVAIAAALVLVRALPPDRMLGWLHL